MPTNYTNNSSGFANSFAPSTYTTPMYSFAMNTVFKSPSDATGVRELWASALTGSGAVNRFIHATFDALVGWVVDVNEATLTPSTLNTEMKAVPPNMVGAGITSADFAAIEDLLYA